jgi:hypothetical protein
MQLRVHSNWVPIAGEVNGLILFVQRDGHIQTIGRSAFCRLRDMVARYSIEAIQFLGRVKVS